MTETKILSIIEKYGMTAKKASEAMKISIELFYAKKNPKRLNKFRETDLINLENYLKQIK